MKLVDLAFAALFIPAAPFLLPLALIADAVEKRAHEDECAKWQTFDRQRAKRHSAKFPIWKELNALERAPNNYENQQRRAELSRRLDDIDKETP